MWARSAGSADRDPTAARRIQGVFSNERRIRVPLREGVTGIMDAGRTIYIVEAYYNSLSRVIGNDLMRFLVA